MSQGRNIQIPTSTIQKSSNVQVPAFDDRLGLNPLGTDARRLLEFLEQFQTRLGFVAGSELPLGVAASTVVASGRRTRNESAPAKANLARDYRACRGSADSREGASEG